MENKEILEKRRKEATELINSADNFIIGGKVGLKGEETLNVISHCDVNLMLNFYKSLSDSIKKMQSESLEDVFEKIAPGFKEFKRNSEIEGTKENEFVKSFSKNGLEKFIESLTNSQEDCKNCDVSDCKDRKEPYAGGAEDEENSAE